MELFLTQVEQAIGARLLARADELDVLRAKRVGGWTIDSRSVAAGDVFFAIQGDRFDGHAFLPAVFSAGAAAAVVSERVEKAGGPLLKVNDTIAALQQLARRVRDEWKKPLVAVTGSAGKTSTKDIIAELLSVRFQVGKTIGNFNNHIGLPLSLLRLPEAAQVAVIEMGMNHAGEIRQLAAIARPQMGVITNVGYAHVEAFESIEGVAAAKRELIEALPNEGVAILNADDWRVLAFQEHYAGRVLTYGTSAAAALRAEALVMGTQGSSFRVNGVSFETRLAGRHAVLNILAGLAVAHEFEIPLKELEGAVRQLTPGKMRGERREVRGATVLNDSYNSNPEAARAMVDVLMEEPAKRRVAVLGEMRELGNWTEPLHRELGRYVAERGVDLLIGVGGACREMVEESIKAGMRERCALFFEDADQAGDFLREHLRAGDALLFKGSRGTRVEKALAKMEG